MTGDLYNMSELPKAQVLIFKPELTCSVWQDFIHKARTLDGLEKMLRQGVRCGRYVGYRLIRIEAEYIGVSWPSRRSEPLPKPPL